MSGRFPVHTGISANSAGVNDTTVTLIDAPGLGASPFRFRGTTLTDWLVAKDPRTRVLSVSRKDRAAILPIGRSKQPVFWYAPNGSFTTSTYYGSSLPDWVKAFNARRLPASFAGHVWRPLLPDSAYAEPDSVPIESGGIGFLFPYATPTSPDTAALVLAGFPWMSSLPKPLGDYLRKNGSPMSVRRLPCRPVDWETSTRLCLRSLWPRW